MGVIPDTQRPCTETGLADMPGAANGAANPESFWQRFARALDGYLIDRSRQALPATTLRRSRRDIDRCRRLLHAAGMTAAQASIGSGRFPRM
jgi:hypothetical protein